MKWDKEEFICFRELVSMFLYIFRVEYWILVFFGDDSCKFLIVCKDLDMVIMVVFMVVLMYICGLLVFVFVRVLL